MIKPSFLWVILTIKGILVFICPWRPCLLSLNIGLWSSFRLNAYRVLLVVSFSSTDRLLVEHDQVSRRHLWSGILGIPTFLLGSLQVSVNFSLRIVNLDRLLLLLFFKQLLLFSLLDSYSQAWLPHVRFGLGRLLLLGLLWFIFLYFLVSGFLFLDVIHRIKSLDGG